MRFLTAILITLFAAGCSDDTQTPAPDLALDAKADQAQAVDGSGTTGKATDLKLGLHDNKVKVVLASMTVVGTEATVWDLFLSHSDPVDKLPAIQLGAGVTAQSLGSTTTFHNVKTAPTTGYTADDPSKDIYAIGSSWRNGGSGTTGFAMTKNVYALKLADGTYAKIEVLSAKAGEIHILAYRQAKVGSTDLTTTP